MDKQKAENSAGEAPKEPLVLEVKGILEVTNIRGGTATATLQALQASVSPPAAQVAKKVPPVVRQTQAPKAATPAKVAEAAKSVPKSKEPAPSVASADSENGKWKVRRGLVPEKETSSSSDSFSGYEKESVRMKTREKNEVIEPIEETPTESKRYNTQVPKKAQPTAANAKALQGNDIQGRRYSSKGANVAPPSRFSSRSGEDFVKQGSKGSEESEGTAPEGQEKHPAPKITPKTPAKVKELTKKASLENKASFGPSKAEGTAENKAEQAITREPENKGADEGGSDAKAAASSEKVGPAQTVAATESAATSKKAAPAKEPAVVKQVAPKKEPAVAKKVAPAKEPPAAKEGATAQEAPSETTAKAAKVAKDAKASMATKKSISPKTPPTTEAKTSSPAIAASESDEKSTSPDKPTKEEPSAADSSATGTESAVKVTSDAAAAAKAKTAPKAKITANQLVKAEGGKAEPKSPAEKSKLALKAKSTAGAKAPSKAGSLEKNEAVSTDNGPSIVRPQDQPTASDDKNKSSPSSTDSEGQSTTKAAPKTAGGLTRKALPSAVKAAEIYKGKTVTAAEKEGQDVSKDAGAAKPKPPEAQVKAAAKKAETPTEMSSKTTQPKKAPSLPSKAKLPPKKGAAGKVPKAPAKTATDAKAIKEGEQTIRKVKAAKKAADVKSPPGKAAKKLKAASKTAKVEAPELKLKGGPENSSFAAESDIGKYITTIDHEAPSMNMLSSVFASLTGPPAAEQSSEPKDASVDLASVSKQAEAGSSSFIDDLPASASDINSVFKPFNLEKPTSRSLDSFTEVALNDGGGARTGDGVPFGDSKSFKAAASGEIAEIEGVELPDNQEDLEGGIDIKEFSLMSLCEPCCQYDKDKATKAEAAQPPVETGLRSLLCCDLPPPSDGLEKLDSSPVVEIETTIKDVTPPEEVQEATVKQPSFITVRSPSIDPDAPPQPAVPIPLMLPQSPFSGGTVIDKALMHSMNQHFGKHSGRNPAILAELEARRLKKNRTPQGPCPGLLGACCYERPNYEEALKGYHTALLGDPRFKTKSTLLQHSKLGSLQNADLWADNGNEESYSNPYNQKGSQGYKGIMNDNVLYSTEYPYSGYDPAAGYANQEGQDYSYLTGEFITDPYNQYQAYGYGNDPYYQDSTGYGSAGAYNQNEIAGYGNSPYSNPTNNWMYGQSAAVSPYDDRSHR